MFKNNVSLSREEIVQEIQDNVNDFYNFDWQMAALALLGLYHADDWTQAPDIIKKAVRIYHNWQYYRHDFKMFVLSNGDLWNFPVLEPDRVNYWMDAFEEESPTGNTPVWRKMTNCQIMFELLDYVYTRINPDCIKALENIVDLQRALDALPTEKDTEASHD